MEKLLKEIIQKKRKCYFISPHLDDAALSCGGLIQKIATKTDVEVVSVFTRPGNRNSLSARHFMRQCGYKDQHALFKQRRIEDKQAFEGVAKVKHLGMVDGLWRKRRKSNIILEKFARLIPELELVNPVYRLNIVGKRISAEDAELIPRISKKLLGVMNEKNACIFVPYAFGNHIDHRITKLACESVFSNIIYYADVPYALMGSSSFPLENGKWSALRVDYERKKSLVETYKSQYMALFNGSMPKHSEMYLAGDSSRLKLEKHFNKLEEVRTIRKQSKENICTIGLYASRKFGLIIGKHHSFKRKDVRYKSFMREAEILRANSDRRVKRSGRIVGFPKIYLLKKGVNKTSIYMQYSKGSLLSDYDANQKVIILSQILNALNSNKFVVPRDAYKDRGRIFMLVTALPFYLLAITRHGGLPVSTAWVYRFYYLSIATLFFPSEYTFAHKCLHGENILVNQDNITIIDPYNSCIAEKFSDLAIALRFYLDDIGEEGVGALVREFIKNKNEWRIFEKLSIYYAMQTLAVTEVGEIQHQQAINYLNFLGQNGGYLRSYQPLYI